MQHKLRDYFQWFHAHPELSNKEYETTKKIREILEEAGISIIDTTLQTGLVARIIGEMDGGNHIALRCDIDALPIVEETCLAYKSLNQGVMHACGHDFHIISVLGAALELQALKSQLAGTITFIFQAAEEETTGARAVLKTGVLEGVDFIFGIHCEPKMPIKSVGLSCGNIMAAVDRFLIHVEGIGCHGAQPNEGIDPIVISSAIIQAAQTIVSRNMSPFHTNLLSITRMESGNTWNVIPQTAVMEGTVRTLKREDRLAIKEKLSVLVEQIAKGFGGSAKLDWIECLPAIENEEVLIQYCKEIAQEEAWEIQSAIPTLGGEDFALYQEVIKGAFLKIGTNGEHGIHHPSFCIDTDAITPTVSYLVKLIRGTTRIR